MTAFILPTVPSIAAVAEIELQIINLKLNRMELELKIYGALCATSIFTINGVDADYEDFGEKYDRNSENAEDYACGDMRFTGNPSTPEILDKYKITEEEYQEVVSKLEDGLSFGCCGWCV